MTSKYRFLLAVAVMAPLFVWASPSKAETYVTKELVTNGNFETSPGAEWQSVNGYPDQSERPGAPIKWGTGAARSGSYSINLGYQGAYAEVVRQVVTIPTGAKNITISLWYQKWGDSGHDALYLNVYGSTMCPRQYALPTAVSNWALLSCALPDGTSGKLTIDIVSYLGMHAYIDDVSVSADIPVTAPVAVQPATPTPAVLGATSPAATLTTIALNNGSFTSSYHDTPFTIKPFPGYTGKVYARKITTSYGAVYYIFIATDAGKNGNMVIYNAAGRQTDRNNPFGSFKPGLNVSMGVMKNSDVVFLAVAPKKWGTSVSLFQIVYGQFTYVSSAALTKHTTGDLRVKLLTPKGQDMVLGATLMGRPTILKAWSYSAMMGKFSRNSALDKHLRVKNGSISWK